MSVVLLAVVAFCLAPILMVVLDAIVAIVSFPFWIAGWVIERWRKA